MNINPISFNSFGARMTRNADIVWDNGYEDEDVNKVSRQDVSDSYDVAIAQLSREKQAEIEKYNKSIKRMSHSYDIQQAKEKRTSAENRYNSAIQSAKERKEVALALDDILSSKEAQEMIESLPDEDILIVNANARIAHYTNGIKLKPLILDYGVNAESSMSIINNMDNYDEYRTTRLKDPLDEDGNLDKNSVLAYLKRLCEVFGSGK